MSENTQPLARAPRKKHYMDDAKLRLSAEPVSGSQKRPSLTVTVINNNPRIDVYTNLEGDKANGVIHAKMDAPTFFIFLQQLEALLDDVPKTQYFIKNKRPGENRGEQVVESTTVIGKDEEGKAYISIIAADGDRPKIKFYFGVSYFHQLSAGNGRKLTDAEVSVIAARAWVRMMGTIIGNVLTDNYVEPEARPRKEGGGGNWKSGGGGGGWKGGGGQNRQGGGGGWNNNRQYQKPAATVDTGGDDFADDLPM